MDIETLIMIYYSLVYPYLQYGALTWDNTYKTRLNQINTLNNKASVVLEPVAPAYIWIHHLYYYKWSSSGNHFAAKNPSFCYRNPTWRL